MYQKILLVGNVGSEPVMRYTADGTPVTSFSLATNEAWGSGDDRRKKTTWWKCSCWRKSAETANEHIKVGALLLVEGTMVADENGSPRVWQSNDGVAKSSFELNVSNWRFVGSKHEDESGF